MALETVSLKPRIGAEVVADVDTLLSGEHQRGNIIHGRLGRLWLNQQRSRSASTGAWRL